MLIVYLLVLHFIADFLLQPRWMATKKSSDAIVLLSHITRIISVFGFGLVLFYGHNGVAFAAVNGAVHALIDWNIWKGYKLYIHWKYPEATAESWRYWEDSAFYATIGFDQLLHTVTIVILAGWLLK